MSQLINSSPVFLRALSSPVVNRSSVVAKLQHFLLEVMLYGAIICLMLTHSPPKFPVLLLSIATAVLMIIAGPALAGSKKTPVIEGINLSQGKENVLLTTSLSAELDEFMKEALKGGVPLTFRFKIRLTRKGSILGEKLVRSEKLIHVLQYNPVKQLYQFTGQGYAEPLVRTTKDESEALTWMKGVHRWPLYPLEELKRGTRYRVRVMATLDSVELPSVFGYLFFFTSIFNRETPWVQVDFTY